MTPWPPPRSAAALVVGLVVVGCADPGTPFRFPELGDAGPRTVGPPGEVELPSTTDRDTDEDGLCDLTEEGFGLDPESPDTDGDGTWDLVELAYYYAPRSPHSPRAEELVVFVDGGERARTVPFTVRAPGDGGSYRAVFEPIEAALNVGASSADFLDHVVASATVPEDAAVEVRDDVIAGVLRDAELQWLVSFRLPTTPTAGAPDAGADEVAVPTDCVAAYPFALRVEVIGGEGLLALERALVVHVPPGLTFGDRWCGTSPPRCL